MERNVWLKLKAEFSQEPQLPVWIGEGIQTIGILGTSSPTRWLSCIIMGPSLTSISTSPRPWAAQASPKGMSWLDWTSVLENKHSTVKITCNVWNFNFFFVFQIAPQFCGDYILSSFKFISPQIAYLGYKFILLLSWAMLYNYRYVSLKI